MRIDGRILPNIGFIRAKPQKGGTRFTLAIYPPTTGPLEGCEPATMLELDVCATEVLRIAKAAPHLIAAPRGGWHWQ
jgi:hypothetical protein